MQKTPIYARCHECRKFKISHATCDVMRYGKPMTDHFCAEHVSMVSSIATKTTDLQKVSNRKSDIQKKRSREERASRAGKSKKFLTLEELKECNISLEKVVAEAMKGGGQMFRAAISKKIAEVWGGYLPSLKMGNALARLVEKEVVYCSQEGHKLFTYCLTGNAFPNRTRQKGKSPGSYLEAHQIVKLGKTPRSIVLEMMPEDLSIRALINEKIAQRYGIRIASTLFTKVLTALVEEGFATDHEDHLFYSRTKLGSEWVRVHCQQTESLAEEENPDTISQPSGEANVLPSRAPACLQPVADSYSSRGGNPCFTQSQSVHS